MRIGFLDDRRGAGRRMYRIRKHLALVAFTSLSAAFFLPHQHLQLQRPDERVTSLGHASPLLTEFLVAGADAAEESSPCTLCILQRLLGLGLSAGTPTLQSPNLVGVLVWASRSPFTGIHTYSGEPRSPPVV